ncbi:hypothetical protein FRC07_009400, partial [Ceratobasidium sp. 392]
MRLSTAGMGVAGAGAGKDENGRLSIPIPKRERAISQPSHPLAASPIQAASPPAEQGMVFSFGSAMEQQQQGNAKPHLVESPEAELSSPPLVAIPTPPAPKPDVIAAPAPEAVEQRSITPSTGLELSNASIASTQTNDTSVGHTRDTSGGHTRESSTGLTRESSLSHSRESSAGREPNAVLSRAASTIGSELGWSILEPTKEEDEDEDEGVKAKIQDEGVEAKAQADEDAKADEGVKSPVQIKVEDEPIKIDVPMVRADEVLSRPETPPKAEETPVKVEETPVKAEETTPKLEEVPEVAPKVEEAPAKVEETPVKVEQTQVKFQEPLPKPDAPTKVDDSVQTDDELLEPVYPERTPLEDDEELMNGAFAFSPEPTEGSRTREPTEGAPTREPSSGTVRMMLPGEEPTTNGASVSRPRSALSQSHTPPLQPPIQLQPTSQEVQGQSERAQVYSSVLSRLMSHMDRRSTLMSRLATRLGNLGGLPVVERHPREWVAQALPSGKVYYAHRLAVSESPKQVQARPASDEVAQVLVIPTPSAPQPVTLVTDLDMADNATHAGVNAFVDKCLQERDVDLPSGWEVWVHAAGASEQLDWEVSTTSGASDVSGPGEEVDLGYGAPLVLVWTYVSHKRRRLGTHGPEERFVEGEDAEFDLEMEKRYWAYVETHPAHADVNPRAVQEAIELLTWHYTDRLLAEKKRGEKEAIYVKPPFTPEESHEVLEFLKSLSKEYSHANAILKARTVARVHLRTAEWRLAKLQAVHDAVNLEVMSPAERIRRRRAAANP